MRTRADQLLVVSLLTALAACDGGKVGVGPTGDDTGVDAPDDTAADSADSGQDTAPVDTAPHTGETDTGGDTGPTDTGGETGDTDTGTAPLTAADCFADIWDGRAPVDYDQFGPVMGSHCMGTNHQDIHDVQRVVFIGDSITVGSPPTAASDWYRNRVADELVTRFGLEAPGWEWENVNLVDGVTYVVESGDFASCAKWGARTDDLLLEPHQQLEECIPEDKRDLRTLVVLTGGGNDIYSLLEDVQAGVDEATLHATFTEAMDLLRDAAEWVADPVRFPNGAWLVFGNLYDFSDEDGALEMADCPGAQLIGLDAPLLDPVFWDVMGEAEEEMVSIAVDTQTDVVFLGEGFCGHGYNNDDPASRCYRGGGDVWLDVTCMHPSAYGHEGLADMMIATIEE